MNVDGYRAFGLLTWRRWIAVVWSVAPATPETAKEPTMRLSSAVTFTSNASILNPNTPIVVRSKQRPPVKRPV
ncbi:MAG: hypothetical protein JWO02_3807 [Solirubrobacterales bacterium]|nr:hypothetical protein [Solirubrobacterales bacterium]